MFHFVNRQTSRALVLALIFGVAVSNAAPPVQAPTTKPITLNSPRVSLEQVLEEVYRQTGIRVEDRSGVGKQTIQIELRRTSFWEALDQIADKVKARVYLHGETGHIALVTRPASYCLPPTSYDGPFRIQLKRATITRDFETLSSTCKLSLEVAWEPTLEPIFLQTQPQGLRLHDGTGKAVPVLPTGSSLADVEGRLTTEVGITLPGGFDRLGLLEGKLTAVAPTKMLEFSFGDLQMASTQGAHRRVTQEGITCSITEVSPSTNRWSIQVVIDAPPTSRPLDSSQVFSCLAHNELFLTSQDGKTRLPASTYVIESPGGKQARITYHFAGKQLPTGSPRNWKVSYRAPARLVEVPLQFSFRNVDLP
jgi:hypothetical protein